MKERRPGEVQSRMMIGTDADDVHEMRGLVRLVRVESERKRMSQGEGGKGRT